VLGDDFANVLFCMATRRQCHRSRQFRDRHPDCFTPVELLQMLVQELR
jgi:hypothetical protein